MSEKQLEFSHKITLSKYDAESKLKEYYDLLEAENKKINLVSRETLRTDLERLAAESLLPFEIVSSRGFENYLDIGSGGGFPALPIIMCLGIGKSTLVERTHKKAAALKRIAQGLGFRMEVLDENFEECDFAAKYDLITLRLVKLTKPLLRKIADLLFPTGVFIYYSKSDEEKAGLDKDLYSYVISQDTPAKFFTVFSKKT